MLEKIAIIWPYNINRAAHLLEFRVIIIWQKCINYYELVTYILIRQLKNSINNNNNNNNNNNTCGVNF
jgi:hypothetical protein